MAFWRKEKVAPGKHRGESKKRKTAKQRNITANAKPSKSMPEDKLSKLVYEHLKAHGVDDERFAEALVLLKERSELLARIEELEAQIDKLQANADRLGAKLNELKLDHHVESIAQDPSVDEAERQAESTLELKGFREHREKLKESVISLSQLDSDRERLFQDHSTLAASFRNLLPSDVDSELRIVVDEELNAAETRLAALALSGVVEGEWNVTAPEELKEFDAHLEEIAEEGPVFDSTEGDSRFHLD